MRAVGALALADFRERVRRPAYLAILVSAVALGYFAVPGPGTRWVFVDAGGYRGVDNSAYVGTVTALAGALWFALVGFYLVRDAIRRDERTGVGQLLAATPLRSAAYLAGKFLSNLGVLASMAGILAGTGLIMQLVRGESRAVDPVALVTPFVLLTLPVLAVIAAAAVVFDATPALRAGLGNVAWFFVWVIGAISAQGAALPLGGLGVHEVAESMRVALLLRHLHPRGEFSLGLTAVDHPLAAFAWNGLRPGPGFVLDRFVLLLLAAGAAVVPALWFPRFDPARTRRPAPAATGPAPVSMAAVPGMAVPGAAVPGMGVPGAASWGSARTRPRPGRAGTRLVAGELRILARTGSRWWWLGAAVLVAAGLAVPPRIAAGPVLLATWIWPVLLWSRLGTQSRDTGADRLLAAYPAPGRRLLAEWVAGALLTALVGAGPALRMALAGDGSGLGAWAGGVLFIPALALACGTLAGTQRLFQALYLPLWYLLVNGVAAADYMGAVRVDGHPAGPPPYAVAGVAIALLLAALGRQAARHARR